MRLSVFQLAFLFTHVLFISILDIKLIKYICLIFLIIYLMQNNKIFLKKKYERINKWVILFAVIVTLSSIHSLFIDFPSGFNDVSPFSGFLLSLSVCMSFFLVEFLYEKNRIRLFLKNIFFIILFYLVINDLLIPFHSPLERAQGYFIGGKFTISYLHILACVLYYFLHLCNGNTQSKYKIVMSCFFIYSLFISFYLECSTSVIGILILIVLFFFKSFSIRLYSPIFVITYIFLSSVFFLLFYDDILSLPFVQHLIVDILNEDLTLTGRVNIYMGMFDLLGFEPLWGWGNGNSTFFVNYYLDMPNTQNGLLENYINWGLLGVISFLILVFFVIKYAEKKNSYPFINLIMVFIVLSTIEITLGILFLSILPFCLFSSINKNFIPDYAHK